MQVAIDDLVVATAQAETVAVSVIYTADWILVRQSTRPCEFCDMHVRARATVPGLLTLCNMVQAQGLGVQYTTVLVTQLQHEVELSAQVKGLDGASVMIMQQQCAHRFLPGGGGGGGVPC